MAYCNVLQSNGYYCPDLKPCKRHYCGNWNRQDQAIPSFPKLDTVPMPARFYSFKERQNSKAATDCHPHSVHYYRSWRNLLATPKDYEACGTCGFDHTYDGPYVGDKIQRAHNPIA